MNADLQVLMEQLRQRSHSARGWNELMKAARANLKEKRSPLDADDRSQIQQSLEILHRMAGVSTSKELFEHVEELAVKAGLSLAPSPSSPHCRFVMSECFFLEIQAKENGTVDKVFINHGHSQAPNVLLVRLLNRREWERVGQHLHGLLAAYNVQGDKAVRIEAFNALQALEHAVQSFTSAVTTREEILRSPLGACRPREAGRASRIHYFLTPYDMLDPKSQRSIQPDVTNILEKEMGLWVDLATASSDEPLTLVTAFHKEGEKPTTAKVAATFSLKLSEPMVISAETISKWEAINGKPNVIKTGNYVELIREKAELKGDTFYVTLPDQRHIYVLDPNCHNHLRASLVSAIDFVDANDLPSIIASLRREALFAFVLRSTMRAVVKNPKKRQDHDNNNAWRFEVSSPRFGVIDCVFEVVDDENEDDGGRVTTVRFAAGDLDELDVENEKTASRVFKRCWSIPVTLRSVMKSSFPNSALNENRIADDQGDGDTSDGGEDRGETGGNNNTKMDESGSSPRMPSTTGDERLFDSPREKFDAKSTYDEILRNVCEAMPGTVDELSTDLVLPPRQNLLDLFKEIEIWEALIPPRPGQKPLRSPAPHAIKLRPAALPPFQMPTPQGHHQPGASPIFPGGPPPAMIGMGGGGGGPMSGGMMSNRSPKPRHMSSASDTFDAFDGLEELCNMSKAFAQDPDNIGLTPKTPVSLVGTPIGEKPAGLLLERKSSIQDTIDSVLGTAMQPPTPGGSGGQQHQQQQQLQQQSMQMSPMLPRPPPPPSMVPGAGMSDRTQSSMLHSSMSFDQQRGGPPPDMSSSMHHHQRSLSLAAPGPNSGRNSAGATTTINLDVFDFDKSDAMDSMGSMETGIHQPHQLQRWHSYQDPTDPMSAYGLPPQPPPMTPGPYMTMDPATGAPLSPGAAYRSMGLRGGGRGSRGGSVPGTTRRRARKALNVGDRAMEMALKELKKADRISARGAAAPRRPRRARGALGAGPSAQIVTSSFSEGDSPKFTLKIVQSQQQQQHQSVYGQEMMSPGGGGGGTMSQQSSYYGSSQHAHSSSSFGDDSEDGPELAKNFLDSTGGDEILRQQIQALKQQMLSNANFGNLDDRSSDAANETSERTPDNNEPPAPMDFASAPGNIFDNLAAGTSSSATNVHAAAYMDTGAIAGSIGGGTEAPTSALSGEILMAKLRQTAGNKRRNSLDSVIGKLMADKTAVSIGGLDDMMTDETALDEPPMKRSRPAVDPEDEQESSSDEPRKDETSGSGFGGSPMVPPRDSGESTPESSQPGVEGGIKLVIKKSQIKIPKQAKPSSGATKHKQPSSAGGTGAQKLAAPGAIGNRMFESFKQKLQEKKMKKQVPGLPPSTVATTSSVSSTPPKPEKAKKTVTDKSGHHGATFVKSHSTSDAAAQPFKSLKGFKIPKVIDDSGGSSKLSPAAPVPQQQPLTPVSAPTPPAFKKPPFQPQPPPTPTTMPKPILKHSISTPTPSLPPPTPLNAIAPPTTPTSLLANLQTPLSPPFRLGTGASSTGGGSAGGGGAAGLRRVPLLPNPAPPTANVLMSAGGSPDQDQLTIDDGAGGDVSQEIRGEADDVQE